MNRIVEFLTKEIKAGDIDLKFGWIDKNTVGGLVNTNEDNIIIFNVALMITDTLIHELFHYHHPEFTEKQVVQKTHRLINRMTAKQIKDVFVFIMCNSGGENFREERK